MPSRASSCRFFCVVSEASTAPRRSVSWDNYRPGSVPSAVLFAYAAMPPLTDVRLQGGQLVPRKLRDLYWDFHRSRK